MRRTFFLIFLIFLVTISCDSRSKKEALQSYEKGRELGMQGKFDEALKMFNQAVKLNPNLPEAHNGAGYAYYKLQKYDLAKKEFQKAIRLKQNYLKAYNNLGDLYYDQRDFLKAVEVWEKCLQLDSNLADIHAKVGNVKMRASSGSVYNLSEALKHLQKAVTIAPTQFGYRLLLADCYQNFKDYLPNSITEYNTILNTTNVPLEITVKAYSGLGYSYLLAEKDEEALTTIKNGLRLFPDDYLMNLYAGQIFAKSKLIKEAEKNFNKAIQISPKDLRTYIQFPAIYVKEGDFEKAAEVYKTGMKNLPNVPIIPLNFGLFYTQNLDDCEKAIELFQKSIDLQIEIAFVPYGEIGKCLMKLGKTDEALIKLEKALQLALDMDAKYSAECRFHIAEIYRDKGEYANVKEHIQKIIEGYPDTMWAEKGKKILD